MTHKLPGGTGSRSTSHSAARPQGGDLVPMRDPYLVLMAALVAEARANGDPPGPAAEPGAGQAGPAGRLLRLLGRLMRLAGGRGRTPLAAMLSAPLGETPPATYMGITEAGDPTPGAARRADETQRSRAA
jgi:hypothetical protein